MGLSTRPGTMGHSVDGVSAARGELQSVALQVLKGSLDCLPMAVHPWPKWSSCRVRRAR